MYELEEKGRKKKPVEGKERRGNSRRVGAMVVDGQEIAVQLRPSFISFCGGPTNASRLEDQTNNNDATKSKNTTEPVCERK